jgi:phospholipase/carboxylesterase
VWSSFRIGAPLSRKLTENRPLRDRWLRLAYVFAVFRPPFLIFFSINCALLAGCDKPGAPPPTPARTTSAARPSVDAAQPPTEAAGLGVHELVTANGDPTKPLPLVIALHGLGDRGSSYLSLFAGLPVAVRVVALDGPLPFGTAKDGPSGGHSWFDRVEGGLERAGPGIIASAKRVADAIAVLRAARPTRGPVVVTGFSQGGALSYAVATRHPESVDAAFPIGGWLPHDVWPNDLGAAKKKPKIRGFHGLDDTRVPIDSARELVEALTKSGYDAQLDEEPDVAHSVSRKERTKLFAEIIKLVDQAP